jgi:hypothetical protein
MPKLRSMSTPMTKADMQRSGATKSTMCMLVTVATSHGWAIEQILPSPVNSASKGSIETRKIAVRAKFRPREFYKSWRPLALVKQEPR